MTKKRVHPGFVVIWYDFVFWIVFPCRIENCTRQFSVEESVVGVEGDAEFRATAGGCVCGASLGHNVLLS